MRSPNQKLLAFPADREFIVLLDRAVKLAGYPDRSKFIREALGEKIRACGFEVPAGLIAGPNRIGKGGRPTHKKRASVARPSPPAGLISKQAAYPAGPSSAYVLNEGKLDPAVAKLGREMGKVGVRTVEKLKGAPKL